MGDVSLEMIWKRLEEMQAAQAALYAEVREVRAEQTRTNEKLDAQSTTLVSIRRDLHRMQSEVATLLSAVDDHSRRLSALEKDEHPPAHV